MRLPWDGGRLPTEAEWEYAATGGDENRVYPWGNGVTEPLPANYAFRHHTPFLPVGSVPAGNGRWGHSDLGGSMWEWTLDWYKADYYSDTQTECSDCANLTPGTFRVIRGGAWYDIASTLRATYRIYSGPGGDPSGIGWRCARNP